jgi:hypothetical protein
MEQNKWVLSTNGEYFGFVCFDTKEEAIEESLEYCSEVWVGRMEDYTPTPTNVIFERMAEDAYDSVGDVAEGWLEDISKEDMDEFEQRLNNLVLTFLKEKNLEPNFFKVVDIEKVVVDG